MAMNETEPIGFLIVKLVSACGCLFGFLLSKCGPLSPNQVDIFRGLLLHGGLASV